VWANKAFGADEPEALISRPRIKLGYSARDPRTVGDHFNALLFIASRSLAAPGRLRSPGQERHQCGEGGHRHGSSASSFNQVDGQGTATPARHDLNAIIRYGGKRMARSSAIPLLATIGICWRQTGILVVKANKKQANPDPRVSAIQPDGSIGAV